MGYVKIKKASGFDLLSADNVGHVKLNTTTTPDQIDVAYIGGASGSDVASIVGGSNFVQADVDKIIAAIDTINGASGPGIFPEDLSQVATSVTLS
jgi:hypothetical protein